MSGQVPPWLQEQLMKLQQTQQSLQSVQVQRQQLEMEKVESEKALDELNKASDTDTVYKHTGSILLKSDKNTLIDELKEKKELASTRSTVFLKQETQLKASIKEQESKINEMIKGASLGGTNSPPGSA